MFDYHAANDETIIARSHDGDDAATDFLLEKYKPLVKKKARTLFLIGGDNDDLIQEGMIALYKAIRAFRADRESSFVHYASLCIDNQLYNVIKGANRLKNSPLNTYVSLYSPLNSDTENNSRETCRYTPAFRTYKSGRHRNRQGKCNGHREPHRKAPEQV